MIGVFDSGIGGLSVVSEMQKLMPGADLLYVADRAHAPYGSRSLEDVRDLSHQVAAWLVDEGASSIVVACNTASAAALRSLRAKLELPIVGMEPAVKPAAGMTRTGTVAVFATEATFQGQLFDSVVDRHGGDARIIATACPSWVDLVESGTIEGTSAEQAVAAHVLPAIEGGADVLVLGCTHFSYLKPIIEKVAGPDVSVYDPAPAVAAQVERVVTSPGEIGRLRIAGSGDLNELERLIGWVARIQPDVPLLAFPA